MGETCGRCGSVGDDRRTLHMACFYEMNELKIPFDRSLVFTAAEDADLTQATDPSQITLSDGTKFTLSPPTVTTAAELTPHQQYTLRVCKRCRAEWLAAIKAWFVALPTGADDDADTPEPYTGPKTGIFVRRNGVNVEITREEWDRLYGAAQPT